MRCVVRVLACLCAAIATGVIASARADPVLTDIGLTNIGGSSLEGGATPERFLYFSGFDLWRNGGSAHAGLYWSPDGLNRDGFLVKALFAGGSYRYTKGPLKIRGENVLASIMPGWRISHESFEARLYAGIDLQHHRFTPDDPSNALRGTNAGARLGADFWWEPFDGFMLASSLTGSTIGTSYGVRGAFGWRVSEWGWFGPEIEASGDTLYRQTRIGAHATALKTGDFEWVFAAGYVQDSSHRSGIYGRIGVLTRR